MKSDAASVSRRDFLKTTAAISITAALERAGAANLSGAGESSQKTIGIQVGSVSFVDEGVEQVLDTIQERGAVNTMFLKTVTYGRGLGRRHMLVPQFPD